MLHGIQHAAMDFLRFIILMALISSGILLTDHSKRALFAHQAMAAKFGVLSHEDTLYLTHVAALASVQPVSIVVQDGMLRGTGHDRVAELFDPSAHAETEAVRDACRQVKEPVLRSGILYASRQPCVMCMSVMARAGIGKVCIVASGNDAARAILVSGMSD